MPTSPRDDAQQAVRDLARDAGARVDGVIERVDDHEARIRSIEIANAEAKGAAGGLQRMAPWLALALTLGNALYQAFKH